MLKETYQSILMELKSLNKARCTGKQTNSFLFLSILSLQVNLEVTLMDLRL